MLAELTWHAKQEGAIFDVLSRRSDETTLVALRASQDDPIHALVAGQALERVLHAATVYGLSASLPKSPRAVPWLAPYCEWGYGPRGPATTRRPVTDVLEFGN